LPSDVLQYIIQTANQRFHIAGFGSDEGRNTDLVSTELAIWLNIDNAIGAQSLGDQTGIDLLVKVDGYYNLRAVIWV
jgi:hypothetical protein